MDAATVGASFLIGVARYQLWQRRRDGIDTVDVTGRVIVGERTHIPGRGRTDYSVWIRSLRIGVVVGIIATPGMLSFLARGDFDT
ncbi:MAG: hypothetical protein LH471_00780 [Salinibacterium sp.]|nr:hypothetical protein [Salinibacterium sp.]